MNHLLEADVLDARRFCFQGDADWTTHLNIIIRSIRIQSDDSLLVLRALAGKFQNAPGVPALVARQLDARVVDL